MEDFESLPRIPRKIVRYLSSNFRILKSWAIISNLIRFNLSFWQASKPFYRKVKYREKLLEDFQRLPRFTRKIIFLSSTSFCILNPWVIISKLIRFNLGFWQATKRFYTKPKNREKVLEEFQRLPRFTRKIVFYSSTNFCILNPWALFSNLIRFDLGFWQASKGFYRKLKYNEKVLEEFQRFPPFLRKIAWYSTTNFRIFKPWAIVSNLIRFNLGFWQAWKPFYRKLKYSEKVFEEFQRLPRFPRKIFLYSSINFDILKSWAIISNLIRFDLGFWHASKPFYRKLKCREKVLEEFQRFPCFLRKMLLYSPTNFCIWNLFAIISNLLRFGLGFWEAAEPFYRKLKNKEKVLKEFQRLPRFPRKIAWYSSTNFRILKPWAIISNLIRLDLGFDRLESHFIGKSNIIRRIWKSFNISLAFPEKLLGICQPIFAF